MTAAAPSQSGAALLWPYAAAGLAMVVLLLGGAGGWAALAPLDGAVVAPAVVTVESHRKTVQHREGGIVRAILVREGDAVQTGDSLVQLDDTEPHAELAILEGNLVALRSGEARLIAERGGAGEVRMTADLLLRIATEPMVAAAIEAERLVFEARRTSREGEIGLLQQRILAFEEEIRGTELQVRSKRRQQILIEEELEGVRYLYAKGYAPRTRLLALEREAERLGGEIGAHRSEAARARAAILEIRLHILQIEKTFREEVAEELRDAQAEIARVTEERRTALDAFERTQIRAPQSGYVVGLSVHTIGGVVGAGQAIMDIVPATDRLMLEAQVAPQDIDKVADGQEVLVRLSALDRSETPEVSGSVLTVSADRLVSPDGATPYYLVQIDINESELAKWKDPILLPGMPAEAFIKTGQRTALSYLFKPITDSLHRAVRD